MFDAKKTVKQSPSADTLPNRGLQEYNTFKRILDGRDHLEFESENGAVSINAWPDGSVTVHCFSLDRVATKYTVTEKNISCDCYVAGREKFAFEGGGYQGPKPTRPRFTPAQLASEYFAKKSK